MAPIITQMATGSSNLAANFVTAVKRRGVEAAFTVALPTADVSTRQRLLALLCTEYLPSASSLYFVFATLTLNHYFLVALTGSVVARQVAHMATLHGFIAVILAFGHYSTTNHGCP